MQLREVIIIFLESSVLENFGAKRSILAENSKNPFITGFICKVISIEGRSPRSEGGKEGKINRK